MPAFIVVVVVLAGMCQHVAVFMGNRIGNQGAKDLENTLGRLSEMGYFALELDAIRVVPAS